MTPKTVSYKHVAYGLASAYSLQVGGWVNFNMRAITFFVEDKSSSRRLEKFGEDTPTSHENIVAHTLNFRHNFKFSRLIFFVRGTPLHVGVCAR